MRRLMAILLLVCVGILIPASAKPVRICLLNQTALVFYENARCCEDCEHGQDLPDPCCFDLEKLPDSVLQPPLALPPLVFSEESLPFLTNAVADLPVIGIQPLLAPIRGPDSPSAYRAVLGIWRL